MVLRGPQRWASSPKRRHGGPGGFGVLIGVHVMEFCRVEALKVWGSQGIVFRGHGAIQYFELLVEAFNVLGFGVHILKYVTGAITCCGSLQVLLNDPILTSVVVAKESV